MEGERKLYRAALRAVAEYAGLKPETIMYHNHPPRWLGAMRWIVYKLLDERGMSRSRTAHFADTSFQAVNYALKRWAKRAADPLPDLEAEDNDNDTYAEALVMCRERMNAILEVRE